MKRFFWVWVCFFFIFGLAPGWAQDSGVKFSSLSGEVSARPDEQPDAWQPADLRMVLKLLYHVKTSDDSSAILSFADMTTFVLKAESEVVLTTPPSKDSKIKLVSGNIWVNAKKMFKEGTMDIEMNQAVAGIKGTNITCGSKADGSEDRIQVLRGRAAVLVTATQETIDLKEGQELVIKPGGKTEQEEIDVSAVSEEWKDEISKMGDSIDLNEIPEAVRDIMQAEAEEYKGIQDYFKEISAEEAITEEEVEAIRTDSERFVGALLEDQLTLATLQQKVNSEFSNPNLAPESRGQLSSYQKMIGDAQTQQQGFQSEIAKMLKTQFKIWAISSEMGSELEQIQAEVEAVWAEVQQINQELQANPNGLSQEWFLESAAMLQDSQEEFGGLAEQTKALLESSPENSAAKGLLEQIGKYETQIGDILKSFSVSEIDSSIITDLQDSEEVIAEAIHSLQDEVNSYNTTVSNGDAEVRLRASLSILKNFQTARRQYINSQRLYESVMKSASGQGYTTSEQEEITELYDRITDSYQQLGIVAEELQARISDLENQLSNFVK